MLLFSLRLQIFCDCPLIKPSTVANWFNIRSKKHKDTDLHNIIYHLEKQNFLLPEKKIVNLICLDRQKIAPGNFTKLQMIFHERKFLFSNFGFLKYPEIIVFLIDPVSRPESRPVDPTRSGRPPKKVDPEWSTKNGQPKKKVDTKWYSW